MQSGAATASFAILHPSFRNITGDNPSITLCTESADTPLFHEAGVFVESTAELFVTSNRYKDLKTGQQTITLTKVSLDAEPCAYESVQTDIVMGNGGVNYRDGILFCDQGSLDRPGGLVYMDAATPYRTKTLLSDFMGVPFNSINDVVVAKDGAIWFTDPIYGHEQGFRPTPQLPQQVYRFDPATNLVRAMADGFGRPNGIAFSPDESTLYVTDTDHIHGDGSVDSTRASSIYAFTVTTHASEPTLTSRRLFAFAPGRAPDGIKLDAAGNVYSGCLDGIGVWSPGGVPLGRITIPGGVANFCFGRAGEIWAMNETKLWRVGLGDGTIGALLGIRETKAEAQRRRAEKHVD